MPSEKPLLLGEITLLRWQILRRNMGFLPSRPRPMCILATLLFLGAVGSTQLVYPQAAQNRGGQNAAPNTNRPDTTKEDQKPKSGDLELLPVQGNISMLAGAGGNITVQAGRDGILLVDTGLAAMSDKVLAAIRPLSKGPLTYIINTDDRSDHVGGNEN